MAAPFPQIPTPITSGSSRISPLYDSRGVEGSRVQVGYSIAGYEGDEGDEYTPCGGYVVLGNRGEVYTPGDIITGKDLKNGVIAIFDVPTDVGRALVTGVEDYLVYFSSATVTLSQSKWGQRELGRILSPYRVSPQVTRGMMYLTLTPTIPAGDDVSLYLGLRKACLGDGGTPPQPLGSYPMSTAIIRNIMAVNVGGAGVSVVVAGPDGSTSLVADQTDQASFNLSDLALPLVEGGAVDSGWVQVYISNETVGAITPTICLIIEYDAKHGVSSAWATRVAKLVTLVP